MHKNSSLYERHYLKDSKEFIEECRKRNLRFELDFLRECKKYSLLKPVIKVEKVDYYDTFQVCIAAKIYNKIYKISEIGKKTDEIKKTIANIERVLPLLYTIRYFYQDKIQSFITGSILPPFPLTADEVSKFSILFPTIFYNAKKKYRAKKYLKKYPFEKQELWDIRDDIFHEGYDIDPMAKWYPFIKTVRVSDGNKFEKITKVVLLAHDYYILAELLTLFYRDAIADDIFDPIDMFDGGKWRLGKCKECGRETKVNSSRNEYCPSCKKKIVAGQGVKSKCYKCGKPFYKYIDGAEMVTKHFKSNKKYGKKYGPEGSETVTNVQLKYGKAVIYTQCECGALNYQTIDKGWT